MAEQASKSYKGSDIIRTRIVDTFPPVSFEGDSRFDSSIRFAAQIGEATRTQDPAKLPKDVYVDGPKKGQPVIDENMAYLLTTSSGEKLEMAKSEAYYCQMNNLFDGYDKRAANISALNAKATEQMHDEASQKKFGKPVGELDKQQQLELAEFASNNDIGEYIGVERRDEIRRETIEALYSYDPPQIVEGVEYTKLMGRNSPHPEVGLVCRAQNSLMAAMHTASGDEAIAISCKQQAGEHLITITKLGNKNDASAADIKDIYAVKVAGDVQSLLQGKPMFFLEANGSLQMIENLNSKGPTKAQILTEEGIQNALREYGGKDAYDEAIAKPGPMKPSDIGMQSLGEGYEKINFR